MIVLLLAHLLDHPHIHMEEALGMVLFMVVMFAGLKRLAGKGRF